MEKELVGYIAGNAVAKEAPLLPAGCFVQANSVSIKDLFLAELMEAEKERKNSKSAPELKKITEYLGVKPEPNGSTDLLKVCYKLCDKILMLENKIAILENQSKYKGF